MKTTAYYLILFTLILPVLAGCRGSAKKKLIGKWETTTIYEDGAADKSETVEFRTDGTLVQHIESSERTLKWQVEQDGKTIKLSITDTRGDTVTGTVTFNGRDAFVFDPPKDNQELKGMRVRFRRIP